jgi:hypothetical protein
VAGLKASGTVGYAFPTARDGFVQAFKVDKGDGTARLVINGRPFDQRLRKAGVKVPDMPEPGLHIRDVLDSLVQQRYSVIATNDAKSMFYQFELHKTLQEFFNFERPGWAPAGRNVRLRVLPMGICFAPAWAQHVSQYLLDVLRDRMPPALAHGWASAVWIDNFILAADGPATLALLKTTFDQITQEVGLVMKGWEGGGHSLDVLGVRLDLRDHAILPLPESSQSMADFVQRLQAGAIPARDFLVGFGVAGYISYAVARYPLCLVPLSMDLLRRIGRGRLMKQRVHIEPDLREEVATWTAMLATAVYLPQPAQESTSGYATDASTTGLGAVVYDGDRTTALMCRCDTPHTGIHIAEMLAGLLAAMSLTTQGEWTTDNTTAFYALIRGHSGSTLLDAIIRLWIEVCPLPNVARRVASEQQPADALSRGQEPTSADWEEWRERSWRQIEPKQICWTAPPPR